MSIINPLRFLIFCALISIPIVIFTDIEYEFPDSSTKEPSSGLAQTAPIPTAADKACNNGTDHLEQEQYTQKILDYDEAIRLDPQDAVAYNHRGAAYNKLGQHQRAIEDYDEAIRLNPQYADYYFNRGYAYQALGRNEQAKQDFTEGKELEDE